MELQHLSYSSISSYQLCPRAWKYHYLDKIKTPTSPALIIGSVFHSTIEALLRARIAGEPLEAATAWNQEWIKATTGQEINWGGELQDDIYNQGLKLIISPEPRDLLASLTPMMVEGKPVIEKYIELRIPGVPIPIIGYIDIITEDGVPGDFKTSARSWGSDKAEGELQPLFYLAALNQEGYVIDYRFRHYVFVKNKTPKVQVIESRHQVARLFWLARTIKEVWDGIVSETFPPNTSSWKCSSRYCDYWGICRGAE